MNAVRIIFWSIVGAVLGGALAIGFTYAMAAHAVASNPNDPSAGSVATAIVVIFPVGLIGGIFTGALFGQFRTDRIERRKMKKKSK